MATVRWLPAATEDLFALFDWIVDQAGVDIAESYTTRIEGFVDQLVNFPSRGTSRDDLSPGLRSVTYRKRTIIIYRISDSIVEIVRLSHGRRDLPTMFPTGE